MARRLLEGSAVAVFFVRGVDGGVDRTSSTPRARGVALVAGHALLPDQVHPGALDHHRAQPGKARTTAQITITVVGWTRWGERLVSARLAPRFGAERVVGAR